jgi:hypothetical protein
MAILHNALNEATRVVIRAAEESLSSTASNTDPTSQPTNQNDSNQNNENPVDKDSNNSSPLLFFVALGFGVVFTNLWYGFTLH